MKQTFDFSAIKGVVELTAEQASFFNREPSALAVGTTVVVPKQKLHIKMRLVDGVQTPTKSLFAYILDKGGNLIETKEVSMSQFQRRSYGIGDIMVKAIVNEKGLTRGDAKASETNILGKLPEFKVVADGKGKNILVLNDSVAYNVSRGELHNMAQVAPKRPDGLYDFKTKMIGGVEYLDLDTRVLPNLETVAVPKGYDVLPAECKDYILA